MPAHCIGRYAYIMISTYDAIEAMYRKNTIDNNWYIDSLDEREKYNKEHHLVDFKYGKDGYVTAYHTDVLHDEPDFTTLIKKGLETWFIPTKYLKIDITDYVLVKCKTDIERERVIAEMIEFTNKDMIKVLQFLIYFVDTMRENKLIWGTGRGSSTASYVLYLIGIHKVNSLKYELDYKEFLR